ncbi:MAG: hypothetical protein U0R52_06830 [Solirubrobacterales bacterium]
MSKQRRSSRARSNAALRCASATLLAAGALAAACASPAAADNHYLSPAMAKLTNQRYNHNCFWAPPKGTDYAHLPGALPIQNPNLYPDVGSTYFVAQYVMPAGSSITLRGRYPHERYMSFTMWNRLGGGQIGPGDSIRDEHIKPDPGSVNPFVHPHRRDVKKRSYTVHIVSGPVPAKKAANTIYTNSTNPADRLGMAMRNYLADRGRDGSGGVGLPKVTLNLQDGTKLEGQAACEQLDPIFDKSVAGTFPQAFWQTLVAGTPDPESAPAVNPPKWERFWNALYSVAGIFIDDPDLRASTYPPSDVGGFQSNPDTRYLAANVSLKYGKVVTVKGKMPTFSPTLPSAERMPRPGQVRYWSMCTGSSPVSGLGYDCVYDQQVPLRRDRRYTLVISKPKDRPKNATLACGYKWLDFGKGENYPEDNPAPTSRDYVGVFYMRFMAADPNWGRAPQRVKTPGTEAKVMGPYFPRSRQMSKADFQKLGCHPGR